MALLVPDLVSQHDCLSFLTMTSVNYCREELDAINVQQMHMI